MKEFIAIALGSNVGDAKAHIEDACALLRPFVDDLRLSTLYTSKPMYYTDQPNFVNGAAIGFTEVPPLELLIRFKEIEANMGRTGGFRNGPRVIDLDIVFYGANIVDEPELTIPHPRMAERPFVLVPLAELAPDFMHPVLGLRLDMMARVLPFTNEDLHALAE